MKAGTHQLTLGLITVGLVACVIDRRTQPPATQTTAPSQASPPTHVPYTPPVEPRVVTSTPIAVQPPHALPTPAPARPSTSTSDAFAREFLEAHNTYRARHCAAPLVWDVTLQRYAERWAEHLRTQGCGLTHSTGGGYGENLAGGTASALSPRRVTSLWYDEVAMYAYGTGFSMDTGHFTQVVWRNTQRLGCAVATCGGNAVYVCSYDPPGNYAGQFPSNVVASCP